jgi:hypothetical protein
MGRSPVAAALVWAHRTQARVLDDRALSLSSRRGTMALPPCWIRALATLATVPLLLAATYILFV